VLLNKEVDRILSHSPLDSLDPKVNARVLKYETNCGISQGPKYKKVHLIELYFHYSENYNIDYYYMYYCFYCMVYDKESYSQTLN